MAYNIGDMVVRMWHSRPKWEMVGIIININAMEGGNDYYKIRWFDPKKDTGSDKWQGHEFELVEIVEKT